MVSQNDVENKVLIQENINYDNFGCHGMDFSAYWTSSVQKDPFVEFVESHQIVICDAATIGFKRKVIAERLATAKKVKSDAKYVPKYS